MSPRNLNALSKTHKYLFQNLRDNKISQIYKKFENKFNIDQNFIVAVSGGPDSLALTFLTKIYSIKKSLNISYFMVDHGLRNNSSLEAKSVKNLLKKHQISLKILKWRGVKPNSNIQSLAREERYKLLINKAKKLNIKNILTAHHIDDLYENFFIRISRGSGLKGLVSFNETASNQNINLIRPLLNFEKKDLEYLTKNIFKSYVNDPFNEDNKFKRARIRKLIKSLKIEGLDKKKFLSTISNLRDANESLKFYIIENLRDNSFYFRKKKRFILSLDFFNQPHEVIFRSLIEVIKIVGKKYYPPRGKKVDKLINVLKKDTRVYFNITIGNCIINKVNKSFIVSKEQ